MKRNNERSSNVARNSILKALSAMILYLALSTIYTGFTKHNIHETMFSPSGDPYYFLFFLRWWPWAVLHHLNPFLTSYLTYPAVYNLTWVTSIPSLSLIAAPLTLSGGVVFAWNIMCLLAPASSAIAMYMLLRYLRRSFFSAFIGGYIFGFSTYEMAELTGHLHLIFLFPIPLIILLALKIMHGEISNKYFLTINALLYSFLVGASTELATTFTLFSILSVLMFFLFAPELRSRIKHLVISELTSGVIAAILLSPFLYYLVVGLHSIHGAINPPTFWSSDLLNYLFPTPITRIGGHFFSNITSHFTGNYSEESAYIGIILAALTLLSMREAKGTWVRPLIAITAMFFLFSLGPNLHINGNITKIVLPWHLFLFTPLNNALPARFTVYIFLCIAIWVSVWIDNSRTIPGKYSRYIVSIIGVLLIVPNVDMYAWAKPGMPTKSNINFIKRNISRGGNVLILPTNPYGTGPLWLIGTGLYFHLSGGPWGYNPYNKSLGYNRWPAVDMFNSEKVDPDYKAQIAAFCATHHVNDIIVTPSVNNVFVTSLTRMGWPHFAKDNINIYKTPNSVFVGYSNRTVNEMRNQSRSFQLHKLKQAAACYINKGGAPSSLTPDAAIKLGCLTPAYKGIKEEGHWTALGGWLGPQGSGVGVGVGVAVRGHSVMLLIPTMSGQNRVLFYDPKPQSVKIASLKTDKPGTLMFVYDRKNLIASEAHQK